MEVMYEECSIQETLSRTRTTKNTKPLTTRMATFNSHQQSPAIGVSTGVLWVLATLDPPVTPRGPRLLRASAKREASFY